MNLLAGSTGFLGNLILKELGLNKSPIIALGRRAIPNLPDSAQELIIDFDNISALKIPKLETVYLSLGYPLYYQNVLGVMSSSAIPWIICIAFSLIVIMLSLPVSLLDNNANDCMTYSERSWPYDFSASLIREADICAVIVCKRSSSPT